MQLSDLLTNTATILQDSSNTRWSTSELTYYLNDGLRDFVLKAYPLRSMAHLALDPSQAPIGAFWTVPSDLIDLVSLQYGGLACVKTTPEALAQMHTAWETESGEPRYYTFGEVGMGLLRPFPYPAPAIAGPTSAPTITGGSSGVARSYSVSFYDGTNESLPSPFVTTTKHSGAVLASIPTGPAGTTARYIYATAAGVNNLVMYLLATIADNTTTTYTDNGAALTTSQEPQAPLITYNRIAATLANNTDVPEIPTVYHQALIWYAVAQSYLKDFEFKDPTKAQVWQAKYLDAVDDSRRRSARNFDRSIRRIPVWGF